MACRTQGARWVTRALILGCLTIGFLAPPLAAQEPPVVPVIGAAGPQGSWPGVSGAGGYALGAWNGTSDQVSVPGAGSAVVLDKGSRYVWAANTTDVRAPQSPDQSTRRAATWYDRNQLQLRVTLANGYTGNLNLYALDWDSTGRRQTVTVSDGTTSRQSALTSSFNQGAWMTFPVVVTPGGTITITIDRVAGTNAVLSAITLGGPLQTEPPVPPAPPVVPVIGAAGPQGSWPGVSGAGGYALGAWNGTSDQVSLPGAGSRVVLDKGSRYVWAANTSEVRAPQSPDQSTRRAATWYDRNQLQLRVTLANGYTGNLNLYALDWDTTARRQTVTVSDGTTTRQSALTSSFSQGAWMTFPVVVTPGGTITITIDRTAGTNAVLSAITLGGPLQVEPPEPPLPPVVPVIGAAGPQGTWPGVSGAGGYALGAWNGTSDQVSLPGSGSGVTLDKGSRYVWAANTTDVRAPQSPDQSTRRAATWYHANQLQLHVTLAQGYTGNLNLYALDWDTTARRQTVTVSDGTTTRQSALTSSFSQGAWMAFPVNVAPGGTITITIDRAAGLNAVLSAITLGGPLETEPPAPGVLLDSFGRADSPSLGVTDTGQTWSGLEGSFGVQGGAAGVGTAGYSLAVVDSGDGDGVVSTRVAVPSSELWLVLRSSDGTNYWRFGRTSTGPYQLQQIVDGSLGSPALTTLATVNAAAEDAMACRLNGPLISCEVNGTPVVSASSGFNQTASRVGFATYQGGSPSPARFDDLQVIDLPVGPDVAVALTDVDPVSTGGDLTWTAQVTNLGTTAANAVAVTAPLPPAATGVAATTTTGSCTTTTGLACQLGTLAPGQTATITITGTAPSEAATLTLTVTATTTSTDATPANNTATQTTTVQNAPAPGVLLDSFGRADSPSLGVTDTGQTWSGLEGSFGVQGGAAGVGTAGYSLAVVDSGDGDGVVSTRVAVPSSELWLVLRSSDGTNYWRFGRTSTGPYQLQQIVDGSLGSPALTTLATVNAAAEDAMACRLNGPLISCEVNGTPVVSASSGFNQTASRVGFATYQGGSPSPARFDDLQVIDLPVGPDVAVALTDVDPVSTGGDLTWTAQVTNLGTTAANVVAVTAPLPPAATGVAATTTTGSCTTTTGLACQLGTLAPGQTATITITGTAPSEAATLTLTVTATTTSTDATPANNTATQTTTVQNAPAPVIDSFDRADSPSLGVTDTGQTWAIHGGGFGIAGGTAAPASSAASFATIDAGFAFGTYEVRVDETGNGQFWAVFRYEDANNYFRVGPDATGRYRVQKVANGQVGNVAIAFQRNEITAADGDVIRIVTRPDDGIFVSVNGVHLTDAGDEVGMHEGTFGVASASLAPRFGSLVVNPVMSSVVTSLDTFSRPDNAVIDFMEHGTRYPWWYGSTWQVFGGKAYNPNGGYGYTAVDATSEAGDVSARVVDLTTAFGIVFRRAGDGSHYRFGRLGPSGGYNVDVVTGTGIGHAPPVPVTYLSSPVPTAGDTIEVRQHLDGRVEGWVNGTLVLRFTDPTTNLRATHYGLFAADGNATFDDFTVVPEPLVALP